MLYILFGSKGSVTVGYVHIYSVVVKEVWQWAMYIQFGSKGSLAVGYVNTVL